jgi:dolichyl-phosphate-mannose--protein O-mannosyl transferase
MNDIYMLCAFVWSLYMAVKSRWKSAAILYGLSLASKWSALYGVIPLAFIYLSQNNPRFWTLKLGIRHLFFAIKLLLIAIAIYILSFTPFILAGHTWDQWWELHRQMWYYHTHLVATHGYQSTPLEWLFDVRPVWYFVKYLGESISNIYVIGNPIILWLGLVTLILQIKKIRSYPYSLFIILYSIFTLPWIISPRIMFYYHYLPSATFLCIILASWLYDLAPRYRNSLILLSVLGLMIVAPMLYGFVMPKIYWDTLFNIIPSWK